MAKNKIVAVGVGFASIVGLLLLRKKPMEKVVKGKLSLQILDAAGNPVPHNSPLTLYEGSSYTILMSITNETMMGGSPYSAELDFSIFAGTNYRTFLPTTTYSYIFAAAETLEQTWPLEIDTGSAGEMGSVVASVQDPDGNVLDNAAVNFDIASGLTYGALLDLSVS